MGGNNKNVRKRGGGDSDPSPRGGTSNAEFGTFGKKNKSSFSGSLLGGLLRLLANSSAIAGMLVVLIPLLIHQYGDRMTAQFNKWQHKTLCKVGIKSKKQCDPTSGWVRVRKDSDNPVISNLATWMKDECEATGVDNVYLGDFKKSNGKYVRGIGFTKNLKKGQYFLCLPSKCWFGQHNAPQRYLDMQTKYPQECETIQYVMALWMADEFRKGSKSFWKPYFDTIPKQSEYEMYHPAFYESSGKRFYQKCLDENGGDKSKCEQPWDAQQDGSHLWRLWYGWVGDCYDKYVEEWKAGTWHVPDDEPGADVIRNEMLTVEEVRFTYVLTMTRDFEGVGNLPLIDMPNTEEEYNSHQYWFDDKKDKFCLLNEKNVKKGDEINVNYAQSSKTPFMMFAQYGFALEPKYHASYAKESAKCKGLQIHDDVHKKQNPVAENFSNFAMRYCTPEMLSDEEELEAMDDDSA
ncbi:unnamed protein product [Amoebophrya sp. A25]|nr:unnamed protein product [Amoebophrya sp. A25]|eukprot:GSA25T00014650001.1